MIAKYKCKNCGEVLDPAKLFNMKFCKCGKIGVDPCRGTDTVRIAADKESDFVVIK